jgi:DNA primase
MPYVDFKAIKAAVSIEDAANLLNLTLKKNSNQLRGGCPACGNTDERILAITPARNLFYCFEAKKGGDQIELVCHITGLDVQDAAAFLSPTGPAHRSEKPEQKRAAATKRSAETPPTFDPVAFAAKLTFSDEVADLGLTEETATRLGVGWHPQRKAIYFPQKDDTGFVCGFIGFANGELKMPPRWLEQSKVVKLKRA